MKTLKHHEFVSIGSHSATHRIILLHGWGADADDLIPLGQSITQGLSHKFNIVSLRAPMKRPNGLGRQWYGLFPPNWNEAEMEVKRLVYTLKELSQIKIDQEKTILLGFSQGAAMAIDAGSNLNLGLIISCSGYPHPNFQPNNNTSPILISHCLQDDIVPPSSSKEIFRILKENSNIDCSLYEFDGLHQIHKDFIEIIRTRIREMF